MDVAERHAGLINNPGKMVFLAGIPFVPGEHVFWFEDDKRVDGRFLGVVKAHVHLQPLIFDDMQEQGDNIPFFFVGFQWELPCETPLVRANRGLYIEYIRMVPAEMYRGCWDETIFGGDLNTNHSALKIERLGGARLPPGD